MAARLIPVAGGPPIVLSKPIILVGRQPDCDAVLQNSTKVSRKHCCLARVNDRYLIRDLGSMNGVRVNGERVTERELAPGDEVGIGDVFFVFRDEAGSQKPKAAVVANGHPKVTVCVDEDDAPPLAAHHHAGDVSMEFPIVVPEDLHQDRHGYPTADPTPRRSMLDDIRLKEE